MSLGLWTSAAQSATRCCSPPESSDDGIGAIAETDALEQLPGARTPFHRRVAPQTERQLDDLSADRSSGASRRE